MTPERTFGDRGSYRFDEVIPTVGRLRRKSGAQTEASHNQRVALVRKLRDGDFPRLDLLRALHDGNISIVELLDADSRNRLGHLQTADLLGARPLWAEIYRTLDGMTASLPTVQTYRKSWKALKAAKALPEHAKVRDLAKVNWRILEASWGRSAASWNQLRRAVSRTLAVMLGRKDHPLRAKVLGDFPDRTEAPRMPDLTPQEFQKALRKMPRPLQGPIMTLVLTGMRVGEYGRLTRDHLGRHVILVPGTKTTESFRMVAVAPKMWGWVTASVPCPVSIWVLRQRWTQALKAAGIPHVTLHDLRHCTGQWLSDAGRPLSSIMEMLGHKTMAMTFRYTRRKLRQEDAEAMAGVFSPQVHPQVVSRATRKRAKRAS